MSASDGIGTGSPASVSDHGTHARDDLRAFVTISRSHESDVQQRQIIARLDDKPPVTLTFGEAVTQEVDPGAHRLKAHNTLFRKTVQFSVEPGEHLEFVVINRAGPGTLGFLALLGSAPLFLAIERRSLA